MTIFDVSKKTLAISLTLVVITIAVFLLVRALWQSEPNWTTATVEKDTVTETVSVSGFIEAKNTANLAFPTTGTVTEVFVAEGQEVKQGEVLATLAAAQQVASRNDATAQLRIAQAQYDKLLVGETTEVRTTVETTVLNAEKNLARTISEENEKVAQAQKELLSTSLIAQSDDTNEDASAPSITGSYTCEDEGIYKLEVYNSNAQSNFSYRYTGIESGISIVGVDQPAPLGTCGLYVQFAQGGGYNLSNWTIAIPNTQSTSYVTNANAYALALEKRENAIAQATDALSLARQEASEVFAQARPEDVQEAQATIDKALANIASIDAQINDRSIVAPFDGVVTNVGIIRGETTQNTPVITVLKTDTFVLKARIPEIDITKIEADQSATAVFDAQPQEKLEGAITYVSPLATLIDGVAYFEATITLQERPTWIRSGLNADIEITIKKQDEILRIPKRFIFENEDGSTQVYVANDNTKVATDVTILFSGNDGFVAISGIAEGTQVVAP